MANQPKKYKKFVATAATATLVASAIVPVASAASLSDIAGNTHEEAINALVSDGIISGYQDGTFKPNKELTRSDVVKLLGKFLETKGYEAAADYKTRPAFADLTTNTNEELLKYASLVKEAGVFVGSNGNLLAGDPITRENMAITLVRTVNTVYDISLEEYVATQDFKGDVTDLNQAKAEARSAISVLDFYDITNPAAPAFNPKGNTTRGQFASFLYKTINADYTAVPGVADIAVSEIKAINSTTLEVTLAEAQTDLTAADFKITVNDTAVTPTSVTADATGAKYTIVHADLDGTKGTVSVNGVKADFDYTGAAKVESVSATNYKEVVVTFDGTVDKATAGEVSNYSITQGSSTVAIDKVAVSEDAKSVVLTVVNTLANQKEHKLAVNNVKAGNKVLNQKDVAFTPVDTTLPAVTKVDALGNKTVRVTFSEPVQSALTSNFTIDEKVVVGSIQTSGKTVILKLSSALSDGEHTITSSGVKDYAGFVSEKTETKFNVVEDKVAPTVTKVVSASFEKVVLQFSEPIEQVLTSNVYWMQGASKKYPDANGIKKLSDDTFEFTFSGTNKLVYSTDLYVTGVKDYSGNEIAKDTKIQVNPVIDQTRPEVLSAELDKTDLKTVKVKFSKVLNDASAKKTANYVIKDKDGKVQTITNNIQLVDGGKTAVLTLVNKLADNSEYTLTINGVSDNTTLQNVILPYTTTLTVKDVTAPTLTSVKRLDDNTLVIDYSEAMATSGDGNVLDTEKYTFVDFADNTKKYVPVDLRITGDSKSVIVTFDKNISAKLTATVRLVKDVAGNYIAPLEKSVNVEVGANVTTVVKGAVATGTKTVVVEFERALQSFDANDIIIKDNGSVNNIVTATLSSNGTKATLTLEDAVKEDAANLTYETVGTPKSQDILGGKLQSKGATAVTDEISATLAEDANGVPKVVAIGNSATQFKLTFNENVMAAAGAQAFFEVLDADGEELTVSTATADGTGKDLVITLSESVVGGTVTIALKENPLVTDVAGNKVAAIEAIQVDGITANAAFAPLSASITAAETAHTNATEGVAVGNHIVGTKATLQSAIDAAKLVKNNQDSTTQELTDAKTTLDAAVVTFNAAKVADISGVLVAPTLTKAIPGTTDKGSITGYVAGAGETFNVTSATTADVTVDDATSLALTGVQAGSSVITVQVIKDGQVIKTGTVTVTVTTP